MDSNTDYSVEQAVDALFGAEKFHQWTFIVEGSDCCGKTTFIESLKRKLRSVTVIHNGVYPTREEAFSTYRRQCVNEEKRVLILDRSYISELIYGGVLRNEDNSQWFKASRDLEFLYALRSTAIVVHCEVPLDVCLTSWKKRIGEEYVKKEEQITKIYNEYRRIEKYTKLPVVKYSYLNAEEGLMNLIKEML